MPIECVWFDEQPELPASSWQPGWCNPVKNGWAGGSLSKHYLEQVASIRPPIVVLLPTRSGGAVPWCIDWFPTDEPDGAWTVDVPWPLVVGAKPDITVAPSINAAGLYHGYLQHGVLTDDLGG